MYTSVALLALSGFLAAAPAREEPSWLTDYPAARAQGMRQHKPLAVFLGNGKTGWDQVSHDGKLGKEVQTLLADEYVCVYVDTSKRAGRDLASEFEVPDGLGIVISDRSGRVQAFRHEGELAAPRLAEHLRRFADPSVVVQTTERNVVETIRYYPPQTVEQYAPPVVPVQYGNFGSFGGGGGRSC